MIVRWPVARDRPAGDARLSDATDGKQPRPLPDFFFLLKTQNPCEFIRKTGTVKRALSWSAAIRGVPAGGALHRLRRCATRTNEGTLKGTRLRLFFAADGPPAR